MNDSPRYPSAARLPASAAATPPFRLDGWLVEPTLNRISRDGRSETIEPRMMHVLVCLAAVPGEVVSRRDLLDVVWGEVVVGEEVLTRVVSRLRAVLGDDRQDPQFLETIRGGGYRLLARPESAAGPADDPAERRSGRSRLQTRFWIVVVAVLVLIWAVGRLTRRESAVEIPAAVPVTTLPGNEAYPALAPDGLSVVFTWTGGDDEAPGLFLKQFGSEEIRRLTRPEGFDSQAAFAPDGATVAFVRRTATGRSLCSVPVMGGATRLLTETAGPVFGLSWSPGGDHLVYASQDTSRGQHCLLRLDLENLAVTPLTTVDTATHIGDSWPVHAPDGGTIAFARCDHAGLREVWLVPVAGGEGRQVSRGLNDCQGLAWLPGGEALIASSPILGRTGLWRVDLGDGRISWLPMIAPGENTHPALAADGSVLVFRSLQRDLDLKRLIVGSEGEDSQVLAFVPSTRNEHLPAWSPDGRHVAFVSDRTGVLALWLVRTDGTQARNVAAWDEAEITSLFWAPDNRRMAVNLMAGDRAWVEMVDTATGLTHALGDADIHQYFCGWLEGTDRAGLLRDEGPAWQLYLVDPESGESETLDLELAGHPRVVAGTGGFFFNDPDDGSLWLLPADGQPRRQLVAGDAMSGCRAVRQAAGDLYLLRADQGRVLIEAMDLAGGSRRQIAEAPARTFDLAVSADGEHILLNILAEVRSDLMQVPGPPASVP